MDSGRSSSVATFFLDGPLEAAATVELGESEAHHVRVRRLTPGERVRLINGAGTAALGALARVTRGSVTVAVEHASRVLPLPPIHLLAPVADRERMLWLAEKATELGLTSWRAVAWRRSRGVAPRGEGETFHGKVRARMISAITQSGGAWLPAILPDVSTEEVVETSHPGMRFLLDGAGEPMLTAPVSAPLTIAVGPEGGLDDDERGRLIRAGWMPVSLGRTTLRFETAGTAALSIARAAFAANLESARG